MSHYRDIQSAIAGLSSDELARLESYIHRERLKATRSPSRDGDLDEAYAAMAADKGREAMALEWSDALFPGVSDETR